MDQDYEENLCGVIMVKRDPKIGGYGLRVYSLGTSSKLATCRELKRGWLTEKNKTLLGNVSLSAKCYLLNPNKHMSEGKICHWMKSL